MALYPKAGTTLQLWIYWSNGSSEGTKKSGDLMTGKLFMNILSYGVDPWSIRKLARDETCRMDLGSAGRVRDCTGSGPLVHKPASLQA